MPGGYRFPIGKVLFIEDEELREEKVDKEDTWRDGRMEPTWLNGTRRFAVSSKL